jgi:predicted 3-demethylubiquinone-9 3-methyltransferase (glyoxalase superfamily)
MPHSITPFLMFTGQAEEAMRFYTSLFPDSEIVHMSTYGPEAPGQEGTVVHATFKIKGQEIMASDSPPVHAFTFTPSTSFFIQCEDKADHARLFAALSEGGSVMMPPDSYSFSTWFAWCSDRFGVSWQLNVA